jgi:dTDP-4-dehydrorhamnose reductase
MESTLATTGALVVRTHAYGWSPVAARGGFAERAWHALASSVALPADGRRHATPILASDLAELLARAYELNLQGLHHISGAERTSPFRFVRELAAACGLQSLARSHSIISELPRDLWEGETSMNSRRARRVLEVPMPLLREGLGRFAQQADNGWRDRLQAGGQTPLLERAA